MALWRRPTRIFLIGDSIARGFGLGVYATAILPTHPLWVMSSPWRMANAVLRENAIPATVYFSRTLTFSSYLDLDAEDIDSIPITTKIAALIADGEARAGDWLIFQQAGPHGSDPDAHQAAVETVLEAATSAGVNRAVMTTYNVPGVAAASDYEAVFGARTINQATLDAAEATETPVIDVATILAAYRTATLAADGLDPMRGDGIHMNVWGQMKMTGAMLDSIGLGGEAIGTFTALADVAAANSSDLGYGASAWSAEKARAYCEAIRG